MPYEPQSIYDDPQMQADFDRLGLSRFLDMYRRIENRDRNDVRRRLTDVHHIRPF